MEQVVSLPVKTSLRGGVKAWFESRFCALLWDFSSKVLPVSLLPHLQKADDNIHTYLLGS